MVLKIVISKHQSNQHSDLRILLQKCWEETYFSELSENTTKTMIESLSSDDVGGLFPNNDEQIFVALYDGQPVGCAVSAARGAITYSWGFYILAGYQRLGIGTLLLHRAIAAHGHSNLVQLTVLKTSVNAVAFYLARGFEHQNEIKFEILPGQQVPAIIMTTNASAIR